MKKVFVFCLAIGVLFACSSDSDGAATPTKDGQGGSLAIFALAGNYLYTVDESTLNVFSIANQILPSKVNDIDVGWNIETLFAHDDYLYIGSRDGMYIYSIANPENPQFISSAQHITACDPVVSNGTTTFVTLHTNSFCGGDVNALQVYDTTDEENPILIHQRALVQPKGLGLYGNFLVVCDDQIKIFDVTNPSEPTLVKAIEKLCFDVIIKDDTLFAIGDGSLTRYHLNPTNIDDVQLESEITF